MVSSNFAAVFIAVALWLTVSSTLSTRAKGVDGDIDGATALLALAQRIALLFGGELLGTSLCVASQPPLRIGRLTSAMMRPSLS